MNELATGKWQQYQVITLLKELVASFIPLAFSRRSIAIINLIANCNVEVNREKQFVMHYIGGTSLHWLSFIASYREAPAS